VTLREVGGSLKSWKTLKMEGSGSNLMGKISTNPRYVIDIAGTGTLSLRKLRGGLILKN